MEIVGELVLPLLPADEVECARCGVLYVPPATAVTVFCSLTLLPTMGFCGLVVTIDGRAVGFEEEEGGGGGDDDDEEKEELCIFFLDLGLPVLGSTSSLTPMEAVPSSRPKVSGRLFESNGRSNSFLTGISVPPLVTLLLFERSGLLPITLMLVSALIEPLPLTLLISPDPGPDPEEEEKAVDDDGGGGGCGIDGNMMEDCGIPVPDMNWLKLERSSECVF